VRAIEKAYVFNEQHDDVIDELEEYQRGYLRSIDFNF